MAKLSRFCLTLILLTCALITLVYKLDVLKTLQKERKFSSTGRKVSISQGNFDLRRIKEISRAKYAERLEKLRIGCNKWGQEMAKKSNNISSISYVEEKRHLLYCNIPKVGSTTWAFHLAKLAGFDEVYRVDNAKSAVMRLAAKSKFAATPATLATFDFDQTLNVVFVRHPFERLVSSYENRIRTNFQGQLMTTIRAIIARRQGNRLMPNSSINDVTFKELVDFMLSINESTRLNRHLAPQWIRCPFCNLPWDVLGHLETFHEDLKHIIQQLRLQNVLKSDFARNNNKASIGIRAESVFRELDKSSVHALYDLYRIDFELLGYDDLSKYLKWAQS